MYILIYINYTEKVWGMHVWWNYPPCIQHCNKECLPFDTTLVLRGFIPGFLVTSSSRCLCRSLSLSRKTPRALPLLQCEGSSHGRQFSTNFSNVSPSHGMQLFMNCSSVGPSHGMQSLRNRLLQRGSPTE